jgi:hypothetical protein
VKPFGQGEKQQHLWSMEQHLWDGSTFLDFPLWRSLLVIYGYTAKVKDEQKLHLSLGAEAPFW